MDAMNFAYWLQGFFEITGEVKELTPEQIKMIKDHLGYVFQNQQTLKLSPQITYPQPVFTQPYITPIDLTMPQSPLDWPGTVIRC